MIAMDMFDGIRLAKQLRERMMQSAIKRSAYRQPLPYRPKQ